MKLISVGGEQGVGTLQIPFYSGSAMPQVPSLMALPGMPSTHLTNGEELVNRNISLESSPVTLPIGSSHPDHVFINIPLNDNDEDPQPTKNEIIEIVKGMLSSNYNHAHTQSQLQPLIEKLVRYHAAPEQQKSCCEKIMQYFMAYCNFFGGKDLAIDDLIGTANIYFFGDLGESTALTISNWVAVGLTGLFMLVPTLCKNGSQVFQHMKQGNWKSSIMPGVSLLAIAAMFCNPLLGALGLSKGAAIAAAVGNLLMTLRIAGIIHHAMDFKENLGLSRNSDVGEYGRYCAANAAWDGGYHMSLDLLHEFGAQVGFAVLNILNALGKEGGEDNPAAFGLLGILLGSFVAEKFKGEKPFEHFDLDRNMMQTGITASNAWFLASIIQNYQQGRYTGLTGHLEGEKRGLNQLGATKLTDSMEVNFFRHLFDCMGKGTEGFSQRDITSAKSAVTSIYLGQAIDSYLTICDCHGACNCSATSPASQQRTMLKAMLVEIEKCHKKDKVWCGNKKARLHGDEVYQKCIVPIVKCLAFLELCGVSSTSSDSSHPTPQNVRQEDISIEMTEFSDVQPVTYSIAYV